MNSPYPSTPRRRPANASWLGGWAQPLVWVLLVVAGLLLVGFTAVVDDITQRGELRRVQQREAGSLTLPSELQNGAIDARRLLSLTGDKLAGR